VILRIANPYGGTFGDYFKQGFVNSVVRNIKSKKQVEIWGDGNQIRDFINVDDVVKLVFLILSKEDSTGIFNCGTGKGYSLRQVIEISEEILNSKINIKFYNSYIEKIESNILDVSKSKNCFNWNPDHDLRKNLFKLLPFN
jgi:UDP-glucose 4-epimerase